ncbi:MAG: glycoside hydrolase family 2 protein [Suipraeoptans sp.]
MSRDYEDFNEDWQFLKPDTQAMTVTLPHTWNAKDGQDGGNDYYRGTCCYTKQFSCKLNAEEEAWLQFDAVAMSAEVFVNGKLVGTHKGGYSIFRVNMTDTLKTENTVEVVVDNSKNDSVYPQKADFTFYGGIYRNVTLIKVPKSHFALDYSGGPGIKVTPEIIGNSAEVTIETWVSGNAQKVKLSIGDRMTEAVMENGKASAVIKIPEVHLWNGVADPYLYTAKAELDSGDVIETKFGCRTISFDGQNGFYLNGQPHRLCGAARHQDRQGLGNALSRKEHEEDIKMMLEMGANTVRLAHYQHDQYVYDLCDRYGLVVWAEIPYITEHLPSARENSIDQMQDLVVQCYNHPSIICWGLSNEISATGGVNDDMIQNHNILNDLCHKLDATRPTTMAHVFMLDTAHPMVRLPDICSYNLYYGWYIGEVEQNDEWFDKFHAEYPETVIGLSEYGADANPTYQSGLPEKGDWSESYQAVYHEHMLKMWSERPYIWAMHCWNMFDFGADGRDEGGKPGQNQKGLVTFDRKLKKDAFYIYKAYLSEVPFVHICGRRYVDRVEAETEIKVYSNQSEVTLYVDGREVAVQKSDKVFRFKVPISAEHTIEARSSQCEDMIKIRKVAKANPDYFKEGGEVVNWFDKPEEVVREGYYSIMDSMAELKKNPASAAILGKIMKQASASYGDVAKNVEMPEAIQRQMDMMPLQGLLKQAGKALGPDMVKELNHALNQIPKGA